jgi:hypothetical protein
VFTSPESFLHDLGLFRDWEGDDDRVDVITLQELFEAIVTVVDVELVVGYLLVEGERGGGTGGTRVDGLEVDNVGRGFDGGDVGCELENITRTIGSVFDIL